MNLTFEPLQERHFPLLLKWLEEAHVKAWWDSEILWTSELIAEKYGSYVQGYKSEKGALKEIQAFVIHVMDNPLGYIQLYKARDFSRGSSLEDFPESLAAFDFFIGEKDFLGKGWGSKSLQTFLEIFCKGQYKAVFVDPDSRNKAAIRTYEKVGFKKVTENFETGEILMIKNLL